MALEHKDNSSSGVVLSFLMLLQAPGTGKRCTANTPIWAWQVAFGILGSHKIVCSRGLTSFLLGKEKAVIYPTLWGIIKKVCID